MDVSVPGIWQDDMTCVVLSKITHTIWVPIDSDVPTKKENAERLHIFFDDGKQMYFKSKIEAESLLRALALYYETR